MENENPEQYDLLIRCVRNELLKFERMVNGIDIKPINVKLRLDEGALIRKYLDVIHSVDDEIDNNKIPTGQQTDDQTRYQGIKKIKKISLRYQEDKPYVCSESGCDKTFNHKSSFCRHKKNCHRDVCLHICTKCGKSFSTLEHLKRHALIHTGWCSIELYRFHFEFENLFDTKFDPKN